MTIAKNIEGCPDSIKLNKETIISLKSGQVWELKYQGKFVHCVLLKSFRRPHTEYLDWQCLNLDTSSTFFASEMRWFYVSYRDLLGKRIA